MIRKRLGPSHIIHIIITQEQGGPLRHKMNDTFLQPHGTNPFYLLNLALIHIMSPRLSRQGRQGDSLSATPHLLSDFVYSLLASFPCPNRPTHVFSLSMQGVPTWGDNRYKMSLTIAYKIYPCICIILFSYVTSVSLSVLYHSLFSYLSLQERCVWKERLDLSIWYLLPCLSLTLVLPRRIHLPFVPLVRRVLDYMSVHPSRTYL